MVAAAVLGAIVTGCTSSPGASSSTSTTSKPAAATPLQVFLSASDKPALVAAIRERLHTDRAILRCRYLDHLASYRQMKRVLHNDPVAVAALKPATTPTDFVCTIRPGTSAAKVAAEFEGLPGVYRVTYPARFRRF